MKDRKFGLFAIGVFVFVLGVFGIALAFDMQDTDKGKQLINTPSYIGGVEQGLMYKLLTPYVVDQTNSGTIYMRYSSSSGNILIVRITSTSTLVTYEKAVTSWTARASATYSPIND